MTVYLDHNATTPPHPTVIEAMVDAMQHGYGNAASSHPRGRAAACRIDDARDQVADLVGMAPNRLVWTSGATESLNTAIRAAAAERTRLLVAPTEHKAVLDVVDHLAETGQVSVDWLEVTRDGQVTPDAVRNATPDGPFILVVMAANNETGVLNDIAALSAVAKDRDGVVVCDATQQVGKLPVDLTAWHVDYAALSAHKLYGPQGVGALIVPAGTSAVPLVHGGGHQRGWRSGTLNVPGAVGFAAACRIVADGLQQRADETAALRDLLHALLEERLGPLTVNGGDAARLPNTLNVHIPEVDADALIVNCPDVAFASGSACTSAVPAPSHVLTGMGMTYAAAEESVRLSLGMTTTRRDIELAAKALGDAAERIRLVNA